MDEYYHLVCPHCSGCILVHKNELNCRIFRHGVFLNGEPIPPHASQEECERLVSMNQIQGCGKPFQVVREGETEIAVPCGYI